MFESQLQMQPVAASSSSSTYLFFYHIEQYNTVLLLITQSRNIAFTQQLDYWQVEI